LVLAALGALWILVPLPVLPCRATPARAVPLVPEDGIVLAITRRLRTPPNRGFVLKTYLWRLVPEARAGCPPRARSRLPATAAALVAGYEPGLARPRAARADDSRCS